MGEVLVRLWGIQMFLPRPVSSVQKLRRNHMPKAAIENLVRSIRVTARILWALHMTLREGFTRSASSVRAVCLPPDGQDEAKSLTPSVRKVLGSKPRLWRLNREKHDCM